MTFQEGKLYRLRNGDFVVIDVIAEDSSLIECERVNASGSRIWRTRRLCYNLKGQFGAFGKPHKFDIIEEVS